LHTHDSEYRERRPEIEDFETAYEDEVPDGLQNGTFTVIPPMKPVILAVMERFIEYISSISL
jgi:hypothetical protein